MSDELADEIEQQLPKLKRQLLGSNINDPDALVNQLLDLSPLEILQKLFQYCQKFFQENKNKDIVNRFVMMCTSDNLGRKLFHLALHKACFNLVKPVGDAQREHRTTGEEKTQNGNTKHNDEHSTADSCPTQGEKNVNQTS
jgi:hypothetical protein